MTLRIKLKIQSNYYYIIYDQITLILTNIMIYVYTKVRRIKSIYHSVENLNISCLQRGQ